ncbi:MAG: Cna B-type domain-containing protein [Muribaculaceae bacterium]
MKTNGKRIAAWLMTVLLVLSCVPAYATDGLTVTETSVQTFSGVNLISTYATNDGSSLIFDTSENNWQVPVYYFCSVDGVNTLKGMKLVSVTGNGGRVSSISTTLKDDIPGVIDNIYYGNSLDQLNSLNANDATLSSKRSDYYYYTYTLKVGNSTDSTELATYRPRILGGLDVKYQSIYVKYTPAAPSAAFNLNGGSGTQPAAVEGEEGKEFNFPSADGFNRDGYVFKGWSTSDNAAADGSTIYAAGSAGTLTGEKVIYYAVWAEGVTLSFSANNGTGSYDSVSCLTGDAVELPDGTELSRDGYTFMGWGESPDSGIGKILETIYPPGYNYVVTESKTMYAIWGKESDAEFFIRLDGQFPNEPNTSDATKKENYTGNGSGNPGTGMKGKVKYDTFYFNKGGVDDHLTNERPSLKSIWMACETALKENKELCFTDGSLYVSCSSAAEFGEKYYVLWYVIKQAGDALHVDGVLLKRSLYLLSYDPNALYGEYSGYVPDNKQYAKNKEVTVNAEELTRSGYTFGGWQSDYDESVYHLNDTFKMPAQNVTLTAIWIPNNSTPYKVEHYWVDVDRNAVLHETESKTGTTNASVSADAKSYSGYTYVSGYSNGDDVEVKTGTILADGSLVLKLYYTRDTGSAQITKTVKDSEFTTGTREFTFTIAPETGSIVTADEFSAWASKPGNSATVTITVNASDKTSSSTLSGLPTGTYTVTETTTQHDGTTYATTVNGSSGTSGTLTVTKNGTASISFVNTANTKFSYQAEKYWNDYSNAFGKRPDKLTLTLYRAVDSGLHVEVENAPAPTVTKDEASNKWVYTWSDISKYDSDGNAYTYSVDESTVPTGYTKSGDYGSSVTNDLITQKVTVTKTVTGNMGDVNKDFTFIVRPVDSNGDAITTKPDGVTDAVWNTLNSTFKLNGSSKKSQEIVIPYGSSIVITETAEANYSPTYQLDSDTPTSGNSCEIQNIAADHTVAFTNDNTATIDTGIALDDMPYMLLLGGALAMLAVLLVRRRRES